MNKKQALDAIEELKSFIAALNDGKQELTIEDKIKLFKKQDIEKYNPYQAVVLPSVSELKPFLSQVGDQVGDQVRAQVWDQVWAQVRAQVGDQVGDQVRAAAYWGIKVALDLSINHWFFDFLKLGVMVVLVEGKVKVFGKKGKYLGEYDMGEFKK